jgi:SAM-dependent methyltransferase
MIKMGLRLTDEEFKEKFAGKRILLIGEGFGELLPALIEIGAEVVAVDPIYALRDIPEENFDQDRLKGLPRARAILGNIRDYIQEHRTLLRPALAQKLPFKDKTFDYAISHFLVSNLFAPHFVGPRQNFENQKEMIYRSVISTLMESARVVKIGGQALHVLTGNNARDSILGENGLIRQPFVENEKMMKRIWIEVSNGITMPLEFAKKMGDMKPAYSRFPNAEVSLLTIYRE